MEIWKAIYWKFAWSLVISTGTEALVVKKNNINKTLIKWKEVKWTKKKFPGKLCQIVRFVKL